MTAALISLYHPAPAAAGNITAIASQVDTVYLCDNSPDSNYRWLMDAGVPDNVHYTCFHENLGLSTAFNRILKDPGMGWSEEDLVFFFDQDSRIAPEHIRKMVETFEDLRSRGFDAGCLGPVYFNTSSGIVEVPRMKTPLTEDTYAVSSIITSSMVCGYGTLRSIGFWNERVFLDMADWDLCWRITAQGKLCCQTQAVTLHHSLGSGQKKVGPISLRVGQPFREYYQIRECLYLLFRPYTPIKYRIRFLAMIFVRSPLHLLFLDQRKQRLRYICKGFADFFRGKQGALDPAVSVKGPSV